MLVGLDHNPIPPSGITRRLAEINPRLGLKVMRQPGEDAEHHWWAFTLAWAPEDPRWQMVQRGEVSANDAYDAIGQLPRDAGVDEAYGYFVQSAKALRSAADREALLARAAQWNEQVFKDMKQEQVDLVEEAAAHLYRGHFVSTPERAARPDPAPGKRKKAKR